MALKSLIPVGRERNVAWRDQNPLVDLENNISRVIEDFWRGMPAFGSFGRQDLMPALDVSETDKEIEIVAELPGLEEKDVQINVADNVLTIRGEKKVEKEEKDKNYRLVERSYGSFSRAIELPSGVNADAIKATIAKGVLKVVVPKPAQAEAKRVEIKPAA